MNLEEIADIDNIKLAINNAARNKKRRNSVKRCLEDLDETAQKIREIILSPDRDKYLSTGSIKTIKDGAKPRVICQPKFFPDQIIHWAVMQKLSPGFNKSYYPHSYASIPGKGTHKAIRDLNKDFRKDLKGTRICLQFDVKHAYDSVDKELIVKCVERKVKDPRVTALVSDIVYSYVLDGLPKGFYPSAWLFNLFLTPLDNYLKQELKAKYYYRYMDNFQIYGSNKRVLVAIRDKAFKFLVEKLHLRPKEDYQIYPMPYEKKGKVIPNRFTDFIGFKLYRYRTTIRKSIFKKLRRLCLRLQNGEYTLKRALRFFSYWGYIQATDSFKLKQKYIFGKISIKKLKEVVRNESLRKDAIRKQAQQVQCNTAA